MTTQYFPEYTAFGNNIYTYNIICTKGLFLVCAAKTRLLTNVVAMVDEAYDLAST